MNVGSRLMEDRVGVRVGGLGGEGRGLKHCAPLAATRWGEPCASGYIHAGNAGIGQMLTAVESHSSTTLKCSSLSGIQSRGNGRHWRLLH